MQRHLDVAIEVEHADAFTRPVDVLALKYAQYLYGADYAAATRLTLDADRLPAIGAHLVVPGGARMAARAVLFLGVPPIDRFGYADIRDIGRRALSVAARECPEAREIAMTIHGPGFGLDEAEAFESQLAGVFDALTAQQMPPSLRSVVFVDREQRRAERLRAALHRILPAHSVPAQTPFATPGMASRMVRHLRSVGFDAPQKGRAFVAMPFADEFVDTFHFGIADPIRRAGLICERMDQIHFVGDVVAQMTSKIAGARLVVADLTGANPNVYLEVGYAWGRNVPTVLLCHDSHEVKFDVRGHRYLRYKNIKDLASQLDNALAALLGPAENAAVSERGA